MALSASQNKVKNQNKGSGPLRNTTFKGHCSHCGKWGHKKAKCREWLKLTHEEQAKETKNTQKKSLRSPCRIFNATIVTRQDISQETAQKRKLKIPAEDQVEDLQ